MDLRTDYHSDLKERERTWMVIYLVSHVDAGKAYHCISGPYVFGFVKPLSAIRRTFLFKMCDSGASRRFTSATDKCYLQSLTNVTC